VGANFDDCHTDDVLHLDGALAVDVSHPIHDGEVCNVYDEEKFARTLLENVGAQQSSHNKNDVEND
jgi:hypothetical protein